MQFFLFRRSDLRPRSMSGVVGQKWRTSGYHLDKLVRATKSRKWEACLVHDVFERVGAVDSETNKDDVGFGVRKRSQAVVFFLSSSIPQRQFDHLARWQMRGLGDVVLEYGRYVFLQQLAKGALMIMMWCLWRTSGKLPEL